MIYLTIERLIFQADWDICIFEKQKFKNLEQSATDLYRFKLQTISHFPRYFFIFDTFQDFKNTVILKLQYLGS